MLFWPLDGLMDFGVSKERPTSTMNVGNRSLAGNLPNKEGKGVLPVASLFNQLHLAEAMTFSLATLSSKVTRYFMPSNSCGREGFPRQNSFSSLKDPLRDLIERSTCACIGFHDR